MTIVESGLTIDAVFNAYFDCRKAKRNSINQLRFEVDLEPNLVELYNQLRSGDYKIGRSVAFVVTHPKVREVWAADFRDRVVHHIIYNAISDRYYRRFIRDNYACISESAAENILSSLATLDLAPTYSLYPQENGITRLAVTYRGDTVTQQADEIAHKLGRFLYPPYLRVCEAIGHASLCNTILLTAETGTPTEREILVNGQERHIRYEAFEEAHTLYMYMNTSRRFVRGFELVEQHVSLPTAEFCHAFLADAINASIQSIRTLTPRNSNQLLRAFRDTRLADTELRAASRKFNREERHFEDVVAAGLQPSFRPSLRKPSPVARMKQIWG